ncbi:MAG: hypothetical protein KGL39_04780 [Patescibacteria group bacterium]|nr:hypothetical protein [Patescibacteria group bacterium]
MTKPDALGNRTFYTIWFEADSSTPDVWLKEGTLLQTEADVLTTISEAHPYRIRCIFRHDYDVVRSDVTEDFARIIFEKWKDGGGDSRSDVVPTFCMNHLPASEDVGSRDRREYW